MGNDCQLTKLLFFFYPNKTPWYKLEKFAKNRMENLYTDGRV